MQYSDIRPLGEKLNENVAKVILGKQAETELILASILCGGHVLMEDVPGTGKTTLAKALSRSLDCSFSRVQFTPDLLPSDITGTRVFYQKDGEFRFVKGPVFTNILLADEINRATPRTQSALLECMEEKQVSDSGTTYPLPAPFLVIATQNPVETQGTFPLPEAQLDRFLIRISLGYPDDADALRMMRRFTGAVPLSQLEAVATSAELAEAQQLYMSCEVSDAMAGYMIELVKALRDPDQVRLGPSPRALLALMHLCQAIAALKGRDYVIPEDVRLAAVPVLAHRIVLRGLYGTSAEAFVNDVLKKLPVPTEVRA